ncbi:DEAD/DEAH box helicase [Thermostaphylospora chromogena]|uniref:DEAD/DEAH box helicase domain-containing protein n=1 Tax=Thermostaphylospora chromogena TaxID=35622 RepID=A0A1H1DCV1_9ACTN|nr:DEAD/DEAH box helicase [Thermostaphylospora chromogena]SDQ74272.1 DEAD/DEAH box helicase domain-containing protein [Thermostaphylospora chromogena]
MPDWKPVTASPTTPRRVGTLLDSLLGTGPRRGRVTHVEHVPARQAGQAEWPEWVPETLISRLARQGVEGLWPHQAEAASLAYRGQNVIISTGTASGKSLAYLVPALTHVLDGGTVLYLTPTKALAADQLETLRGLDLDPLRAACYDGDTPYEERIWITRHANYVLTNPDMMHRTLLPRHARWTTFWRRLRMVVVDECHGYRGVFGSHVAQILRRLRRICARHGSHPVFMLASATAGEPGLAGKRLTGLDMAEVTADASPRGATTFVLWEPPLTDLRGEGGAPVRRTANAETADLLADLVANGVRTLAFVRSRRGAETVALAARARLEELTASPFPSEADAPFSSGPDGPPYGTDLAGLPAKVAAYRAGYLADDRRALERALRSGELLGLATTNALELGVDVSGLDAVLIAGWPGTIASLWQQAGRAGRQGQDALAVLIARDDPLDTYLVHHPEALFGRPVEAIVLDPDNPYVLGPHLCAAAAELPLTEDDLPLFGPTARDVVDDLVRRGLLRRRPSGWYWTRRERATDLADIRGSGGAPIQVVEAATGLLLGTVDEPSAHSTVHEGAVYLHQGETFLVDTLDLEAEVALVSAAQPDYTTFARDTTEITVLESLRSRPLGPGELHFGTVEVTRQVVSYLKRRYQTGEVIGEEPLDLPPRTLRTRAVWWTLPPERVLPLADAGHHVGGAAHAAEHASIGLLPLFATCDRWDIGGVSTELHPDTGTLTVFVYDGHEGGAGIAERGYASAAQWLQATREAIASCECDHGCPSCIQSPKCGNGNDPLDKQGALRLLATLLSS